MNVDRPFHDVLKGRLDDKLVLADQQVLIFKQNTKTFNPS